MTENYHTHTIRCHHATGSERDYIEAAIAGGMKTIGFSDHSPYYFDGDHYSAFRMKRETAFEYVETLKALREEYRGKIDIRIGFEAEYYPKYFDKLCSLMQELGSEYLLLGQHFTRNETDGVCSTTPTDDVSILCDYVNQVCDAMKTGKFLYVAHPDVIRFTGDRQIYLQEMDRICKTSIDTGVPLEINLLGIRSGRHYPCFDFWELAAKNGVSVVLGSDAHNPEDVCDTESEKVALSWCDKLGITPIIPHLQ